MALRERSAAGRVRNRVHMVAQSLILANLVMNLVSELLESQSTRDVHVAEPQGRGLK
jgi:hypothetical protein